MSTEFVTIEQARAFYADADSAHDFEHILRVMNMAMELARKEGGDEQVVHAAALLHDIARHEEDHSETKLDHAEISAEDAKAFLIKNGADAGFAEKVASAIRAHRFRGSTHPDSLEGKILFDADKLDSIGAIGVARAYAVCGMLNQKLYSDPPTDTTATRQQHNAGHTPVDEFHVKLKHLHERFYTPTAQRMAEERHAFMVEFFDRLTQEVRGRV